MAMVPNSTRVAACLNRLSWELSMCGERETADGLQPRAATAATNKAAYRDWAVTVQHVLLDRGLRHFGLAPAHSDNPIPSTQG